MGWSSGLVSCGSETLGVTGSLAFLLPPVSHETAEGQKFKIDTLWCLLSDECTFTEPQIKVNMNLSKYEN